MHIAEHGFLYKHTDNKISKKETYTQDLVRVTRIERDILKLRNIVCRRYIELDGA